MSKVLLSLIPELSDAFESYFEKAQIELIARTDIANGIKIDFILVESVEVAQEVSKEFDCLKNDIRIICLGGKDQVKDFLLANGRLFINSEIVATELGEYVLNKFISGNYNIHLDENFSSSFETFKKFNVINHLNIGQSMDRLSTEAFEAGFNVVSLRSLVDHIVFYLTYLKQTQKAKVPFEFEYAFNEKHLVLNIYAAVDGFSAEFMMDAFGDINSDEPLGFLLGVAAKSCDFLDVTYVEDPGKIVMTAFYAKTEDHKIKGLAFNNILTTSQIITQVEKKLENFKPDEVAEFELAQKQNALIDQELPKGFFEIPKAPEGSALSDPEKREEVMNKLEEIFKQAFPGQDIAAMNPEQMQKLMSEFPDQGFVENLTPEDQDYMIEMMQKKPMIEEAMAFQQERALELLADEQNAELLKKKLAENVAGEVAQKLDAQAVNNILNGKPPIEEQGFNIALDPSAFKAPKFQEGEDPFATAPGEFADPVLAAEQAVQFAEDNFNNPMEAQAFAIQMAEKAHEHFEDPVQAKQFAEIVAKGVGETLSSPEQQKAFADVVTAKAVGEQGPAINVYASASAMPGQQTEQQQPPLGGFNIAVDPNSFQPPAFEQDPFATAPGEFADPVEAAQKAAAFAQETFDNPMEAQAFAIQMAEKANEHFEDPVQAQKFAEELGKKVTAGGQQQAFEEVLAAKALGENGPDISLFTAPKDAAQTLAQETTKNFDDSANIQAFALAQVAQAKDKFKDEESKKEFIEEITSQLSDKITDPGTQKIFETAVEFQLSDMFGGEDAFGEVGDPFATVPGEFADSKEAAQKIAEIAKEKFEDPEEAQAFALNMAFQAQGQFPDAGDFAAALTGEFQESFNNETQQEEFNETVAALASGMGGEMPTPEADPFGSGFIATPEAAEKIAGSAPDDPFAQKVGGGNFEEEEGVIAVGAEEVGKEHATKVKGGKEAADQFKASIKGTPQDKKGEFVARFSNSFEDNSKKGMFNFKSGKPKDRKKELNMFVKTTLESDDALSRLDDTIKAFVHREAPGRLNEALDEFAFSKGIDVASLSEDSLMEFKNQALPKVMGELLDDQMSIDSFAETLAGLDSKEPMKVLGGSGESQFNQAFKDKLELNLQSFEGIEQNDDGTFVVSDSTVSDENFQMMLQQSMSETISEGIDVQDLTQQGLQATEQQVAQSIAQNMSLNQAEVAQVVQDSSQQAVAETHKQVVQQQGAKDQGSQEQSSEPEASTQAVLMKKVKETEAEKKQLELKVKAMEVKLKAAESSNEKLKQINKDSEVTDEELKQAVAQEKGTDENKEKLPQQAISHGEKEKLMDDLKNGRQLNPEEVEKLNKALENEAKVRELAKKAKGEIKKLQMETQKREQLMKSELMKGEKALKAKDSVLGKAKSDMQMMLQKKDKEVETMKAQMQELQQKMANDQSVQLKTELKAVKKQAEDATRMSEVYKNKLETMAKAAHDNKKEDNTALIEEENRNLKRLKTQLENKVNADTKTLRSLEERYNKSKQGEIEAKNHLAQIKGQFKQTQGQLKILQAQNEKLKSDAVKSGNVKGVEDKELTIVKAQNVKLQENIKRLNAKLDQAAKASLDQAKKATKDLAVAQKEIQQQKKQNEKLQAMIEKLQKAVAKLRKAEAAGASETEPSKKEERLEQSVKSMSKELTKAKDEAVESKKQAMLLRKKMTALDNEVSKLKKENDKLKQTAAQLAKKAGKKAA